MVEFEAKRIFESVRAGRYEEALSVKLDATRSEINRAHMKLLARFRGQPDVRSLINVAKGKITIETDLEKGRRLTRIGKKEDAARYLVSSLKRGGSADDHLLAGQTLEQIRRIEEALPYFERAVKLRGGPTDFLWLGTALSQLKKHEQAKIAFEKAVKLRGSADDRRLLGSLYLKTGDLKMAEQQLRLAVALGDTLSSGPLLNECAAKMSRQKIRNTFRSVLAIASLARKHPVAFALGGALAASGILIACFV